MKKFRSKEFIIGLTVIVALAILFFGIDYLKGINLFKPANFFIVEYDNVAGLEVAAPVTINGYKVGQVREIDFPYDRPGKIAVELALDKKLKLPEDTKATISQTLLSGAFVDLTLGHSKKYLPVGSKLIGEDGGGDLMAALSDELMPKIGPILYKVDSLLTSLNTLVGDPALLASIQRLDGITADVALSATALRHTMTNQIPGLVRNANGVVTNLDSVTVNLGQLSYQLKTLPLQPTMNNIQQITANLTEFSNQLKNPNSTLGLLTNDPELYNRLNRVSADVDSLIVDIKRNPKRYISIKLL